MARPRSSPSLLATEARTRRKNTKLGKARCEVGESSRASQKARYSVTRLVVRRCDSLRTCRSTSMPVARVTSQGSHRPTSPASTSPWMAAMCCLVTRWSSRVALATARFLRLPTRRVARPGEEEQEQQEMEQSGPWVARWRSAATEEGRSVEQEEHWKVGGEGGRRGWGEGETGGR